VVVGAGPAGIAALRHSAPSSLCFEQTERLSGICDVWEVGGELFDIGGHLLHPSYPAFVQEVREALQAVGEDLIVQPRRAFVFFDGQYVPYPFQHQIGRLSAERRERCIAALDQPPPPAIRTLADELEAKFGAEVVSIFLEPYMLKSWGIHPAELAPNFAGDRIEGSAREKMRQMWSSVDDHPPARNAHVHYPSKGAFADIFKALAQPVADRIRFRHSVDGLDLANRVVHFKDHPSVSWSGVVCSASLDTSLAWLEHAGYIAPSSRRAMPSFLAAPLTLAALVYDRRDDSDWQRLYVLDDSIIFHKLCLHHNDAPCLRERGVACILAEINGDRGKASPNVVAEVDRAVRALKLVPDNARLTASDVRHMRRAYPLCRPGEREKYDALIDDVRSQGVHMVGRWGTWRYLNADEVYLQTAKCLTSLNA
jgi:protoporphyrinogen oxidase